MPITSPSSARWVGVLGLEVGVPLGPSDGLAVGAALGFAKIGLALGFVVGVPLGLDSAPLY